MKSVSMSGSLRGNVGKKDAKSQRTAGMIPCVIYGGKEQLHFTVSEKSLSTILFTPDVYVVDFDLDGKKCKAIIQDVQFHPVSDKVLHVDFLEVIPGKKVKVSIPLQLTGTPKGVLRGGKLTRKFRKLAVKGLVEDIPDQISLDISKLDILQTIKISDIQVPNLEMLDPAGALVATVLSSRAVVASADEEHAGEESQES